MFIEPDAHQKKLRGSGMATPGRWSINVLNMPPRWGSWPCCMRFYKHVTPTELTRTVNQLACYLWPRTGKYKGMTQDHLPHTAAKRVFPCIMPAILILPPEAPGGRPRLAGSVAIQS